MRCFALAMAVSIFAGPGVALDIPVLGPGSRPCSEWTGSKEQAAWMLGYYTGRNATPRGGGYFFRYDEANLLKWQSGYCRDHPKAPIAAGPKDLIDGLRKSRKHER